MAAFGARVRRPRRVLCWGARSRVFRNRLWSRGRRTSVLPPSRRGKTDVRPRRSAQGVARRTRTAKGFRAWRVGARQHATSSCWPEGKQVDSRRRGPGAAGAPTAAPPPLDAAVSAAHAPKPQRGEPASEVSPPATLVVVTGAVARADHGGMSSSSRILAAVSALALTAATAAPLAGAADNPAPKLLKGSPILFVDNQINPGVDRGRLPHRPPARSQVQRQEHRRARRGQGPQRLPQHLRQGPPALLHRLRVRRLLRPRRRAPQGRPPLQGDHQPGPPGGHAHRRTAEEHQGVGG